MIGADGELRDAHRQARRVLQADVLDVDPGRARGLIAAALERQRSSRLFEVKEDVDA